MYVNYFMNKTNKTKIFKGKKNCRVHYIYIYIYISITSSKTIIIIDFYLIKRIIPNTRATTEFCSKKANKHTHNTNARTRTLNCQNKKKIWCSITWMEYKSVCKIVTVCAIIVIIFFLSFSLTHQ